MMKRPLAVISSAGDAALMPPSLASTGLSSFPKSLSSSATA